MTPEIKAAAKWWADHLRTNEAPKVDLGARTAEDFFVEVAIGFVQSKGKSLTPDTVDRFQMALEQLMETQFAASWNPSEPQRGGYGRVIDVDYHPDRTLEAAAKIAGIGWLDAYLPIKTTMWINPGSVSVRCGYGAPMTTIYPTATEPT